MRKRGINIMKNVATFEKVSIEEFKRMMSDLYPDYYFADEEIEKMYGTVKIPSRATIDSAGYDIVTPFAFDICPGEKVFIPTGLRVDIHNKECALFIFPKSRNVKNSIRLSNTLALVDADYYCSDNEGHIMIALEMPVDWKRGLRSATFGKSSTRIEPRPFHYEAGQGIAQGVFIEFGKTTTDEQDEKEVRNGGYGSTGN